ncbi:hypothetical protein PF010_g4866 [Phytophthora fragariae]|uniref:Uncharacterized protein n=1 Tax=Phytophthora fragariae TaxID=53985 RepID=A0A6G0LPZ8_9STRA|nr:hypothetical protein PF010_g4866 [Phytophthora fragariae]
MRKQGARRIADQAVAAVEYAHPPHDVRVAKLEVVAATQISMGVDLPVAVDQVWLRCSTITSHRVVRVAKLEVFFFLAELGGVDPQVAFLPVQTRQVAAKYSTVACSGGIPLLQVATRVSREDFSRQAEIVNCYKRGMI